MANRTCTLPNCDAAHDCRGLCKRHYAQARRAGQLTNLPPRGPHPNAPLRERFAWVGWDVTPSGCWEWRGSRTDRGYGVLCGLPGEPQGRMRAHRASHLVHHGTIPVGMVVMHSCDNPPCVNPAHLSCGTNAENLADMRHKGRDVQDGLALGRQHKAEPVARIALARELREQGLTYPQIAARIGVHESHARRLALGLTSGSK